MKTTTRAAILNASDAVNERNEVLGYAIRAAVSSKGANLASVAALLAAAAETATERALDSLAVAAAAVRGEMAAGVKTHVVRIVHTDSSEPTPAVSLLEVVASDPREPTPPREIAWGRIERWNGHVEFYDAPVACTIGVRYPGGLAACLRAWGCNVVRVIATPLERANAEALEREIAA